MVQKYILFITIFILSVLVSLKQCDSCFPCKCLFSWIDCTHNGLSKIPKIYNSRSSTAKMLDLSWNKISCVTYKDLMFYNEINLINLKQNTPEMCESLCHVKGVVNTITILSDCDCESVERATFTNEAETSVQTESIIMDAITQSDSITMEATTKSVTKTSTKAHRGIKSTTKLPLNVTSRRKRPPIKTHTVSVTEEMTTVSSESFENMTTPNSNESELKDNEFVIGIIVSSCLLVIFMGIFSIILCKFCNPCKCCKSKKCCKICKPKKKRLCRVCNQSETSCTCFRFNWEENKCSVCNRIQTSCTCKKSCIENCLCCVCCKPKQLCSCIGFLGTCLSCVRCKKKAGDETISSICSLFDGMSINSGPPRNDIPVLGVEIDMDDFENMPGMILRHRAGSAEPDI